MNGSSSNCVGRSICIYYPKEPIYNLKSRDLCDDQKGLFFIRVQLKRRPSARFIYAHRLTFPLTLPGFIIPLGSKVFFSCLMTPKVPSPSSRGRNSWIKISLTYHQKVIYCHSLVYRYRHRVLQYMFLEER